MMDVPAGWVVFGWLMDDEHGNRGGRDGTRSRGDETRLETRDLKRARHSRVKVENLGGVMLMRPQHRLADGRERAVRRCAVLGPSQVGKLSESRVSPISEEIVIGVFALSLCPMLSGRRVLTAGR